MTVDSILAQDERRKVCTKCKIEKPEREFESRGIGHRGMELFRGACRTCSRPVKNARTIKSRKKNPERHKANVRRSELRNRLLHRERNRDYYRRWANQNYKKYPLKAKAQSNRRRARYKNAIGSHTSVDLEAIFARQNALCANPYCCTKISESGSDVDHIMALANGGTNWPDNLQFLCPPCNGRKNKLHQNDWLDRERQRAAYFIIFYSLLAAQPAAFFQEPPLT